MDPSSLLQFIGPVLGVTAAAVSGVFAARVTRTEHTLAHRREEMLASVRQQAQDRAYFRDVVNLAQEPLLYAASDLQSRIYNVLEGGFIDAYADSDKERHRTNVTEYTAFLFGQYFGWAEAIRQGVLLGEVARSSPRSGETNNTTSIAAVIREVNDTLRTDDHGREFMMFSSEQHAIGELMLSWQNVNGISVPSVERYASFAHRYRTESAFRAWFESIEEGMLETEDRLVRQRLTLVQHHLVSLMDVLDPENRIYKKRAKTPSSPGLTANRRSKKRVIPSGPWPGQGSRRPTPRPAPPQSR